MDVLTVLKKVLCLVAVLLWAGGIICGLIYTIPDKALVPILSIVILGLMSLPAVKGMVKFLSS